MSARFSSACLATLLLAVSPVARAGAVQVALEGVLTGRTSLYPSEGGFRVDAGAVDALGLRSPSSGVLIPWGNGRGAFLVWTLRATVVHPGPTASFGLQAVGLDGRELRCAVGMQTDWTRPGAGRLLLPVGEVLLRDSLLSGDSLVFQVAMPMRRNEQIGSFEPKVQYMAWLNAPNLAVSTFGGARRFVDAPPVQLRPSVVLPGGRR